MLLAKYATELKAAGLKRITVSLDTLDPEVFAQMSGGFGGVAEVLDGIEHARRAGLAPIKINTVVQRGVNDHTVLDLLEHFRGTGVIVRFIEYMDVGTRNHWNPALVVPSRELAARIHARWPLAPRERDYRGEVAERYAFDDGAGEIGFISSVSQPFCGDCSRARLSSDGSFYTCLFATQGTDLRGPLRAGATDDELLELIRGIWTRPRAIATASCAPRCATRSRPAQDRDELHRRLTAWPLDARTARLTSTPPTARPWSTSAPRPRRCAKPAPRPSSNYRRRSRASSRAPVIARRRARCSTPPSSPASWPPSARTS